MGIQLSKNGNGYMTTTKKFCQFPGCSNYFEGVGSAKYCLDHRDSESRKIMNEIRTIEKQERRKNSKKYIDYDESNIIIKHNEIKSKKIEMTCLCGKKYELTLFPNVEKYPKYCESHRNPYKREILKKNLKINK